MSYLSSEVALRWNYLSLLVRYEWPEIFIEVTYVIQGTIQHPIKLRADKLDFIVV